MPQTPIAVITMAGLGSRFRKVGYTIPKFQIEARGKPLFDWAMHSLQQFIDQGSPFVFIARQEDNAADFICQQSAQLGITQYDVIEIDHLTDGQATTALFAENVIPDPQRPFFVYNIDTYVEPQYLPADEVRGDGWIPCFPGEGDAWSFVKVDANNQAVEVAEKRRISPHATVGLYYFSSFALYKAIYQAFYVEAAGPAQKERYIAPMYGWMIAHQHPVFIHEIPVAGVHPLGTPDEVDRFKTEAS